MSLNSFRVLYCQTSKSQVTQAEKVNKGTLEWFEKILARKTRTSSINLLKISFLRWKMGGVNSTSPLLDGVSREEISRLEKRFQKLDLDRSGSISVGELLKVKKGFPMYLLFHGTRNWDDVCFCFIIPGSRIEGEPSDQKGRGRHGFGSKWWSWFQR